MSIVQILEDYSITSDASVPVPSTPRSPSILKSPTPLPSPVGDKGTVAKTISHPTLPSVSDCRFTSSIDLDGSALPQQLSLQIHKGSIGFSESSVTFNEPHVSRKLSTSSRKESGRFRPPTPSPVISSTPVVGSTSSIDLGPTMQHQDVAPVIIIRHHDASGPGSILDNGQSGLKIQIAQAEGQSSEDKEISSATNAVSMIATSDSRSTLCIPEQIDDDDGLGDLGSPRMGLKIGTQSVEAPIGEENAVSRAVDEFGVRGHAIDKDKNEVDTFPEDGHRSRTRLRHARRHTFVVLLYVIAGLSLFTQGYDQGAMSSLSRNSDFRKTMRLVTVSPSQRDILAIAGILAVYFIGSLFGGFLGGWTGDKLGRTKVIWAGCILGLAGGALQTCANSYLWLCLARVVSGFGTGGIIAVIPAWCVEVSREHHRGRVIASAFFFNILGVAVGFWTYFVLAFKTTASDQFQWRFAIAFQLPFLLLLFALLPLMPESPRWLTRTGETNAARRIFAALGQYDEDSVEMLIRQIQDETLVSAMRRRSAANRPGIKRRIFLVAMLQIWQRLTGFTIVTYLAAQMYRTAGYKDNTAAILQGANLSFYALAGLIPIWTLDMIGRRPSLMMGSLVMALALGICATSSHYLINVKDMMNAGGWAAGFCTGSILFSLAHAVSWSNIPWIYTAEAFPLVSRARGGSVAVAVWSLSKGGISLASPFLFQKIGSWTFVLFAGTNLLAIPFTFFFLPETNRQGVESVHKLFERSGHFVHHRHRHQSRSSIDARKYDIEIPQIAIQVPSPAPQDNPLAIQANPSNVPSEFSIAMHPRTMEAYAAHKKSRLPRRD
ncbi:and other transporter-domain-containing protein [Kockovaella imperatae]|uniref:And other transporter-domain-containing protein n=1 Tax=Kockovaella imperatae TaxID=4999 RepID=A0A1Y1UH00_9TREE|nr:and other transporter-domain-containing protein [Kockovaella imperatae]ORX36365.1 and other transporter-domain-containing protein [Kockovaella imperatae]